MDPQDAQNAQAAQNINAGQDALGGEDDFNDDLNGIDFVNIAKEGDAELEDVDAGAVDQYFLAGIEDEQMDVGLGGDELIIADDAENEDEIHDAVMNDPVAHEGNHIADANAEGAEVAEDVAVVQVEAGVEYIDAPSDEEQVVIVRSRRARVIRPSVRGRDHIRWGVYQFREAILIGWRTKCLLCEIIRFVPS